MVLSAAPWKELWFYSLKRPLAARRNGSQDWRSTSYHPAVAPMDTAPYCYRHYSTVATWIRSRYRSFWYELWSCPTASTVGSTNGLRTAHAAAHGLRLTNAADGICTAYAATDGLRTTDATTHGLWPAATTMGAANSAAYVRPTHATTDATTGISHAVTSRIPPVTTIWSAALLRTALRTLNKN